MNICLINPSVVVNKYNVSAIQNSPPLGLAYIAAQVDDLAHVQLIDAIGEQIDLRREIKNSHFILVGMTPDETVREIQSQPQIIGISCMFSSIWWLHEILIEKIIEAFPTAIIVLGGEHVTADFENICIRFKNVLCVLGEGEETFRELTQKVVSREIFDWKSVSGLAKFEDGKVQSSRRKRITNLDELRWPNWSLLPIQNYIDSGSASFFERKSISMLTSRGCPFNCKFCSAPNMWTNKMSYRTPEEVIREIKYYVAQFGIEHVEFMDLVGVIHKGWIERFAKLYSESNMTVSLSYSPGTRSEILDRDLLMLLKKINIIRVMYAPDSGSQAEALKIKKNVNFKKMIASMKECVDLKIPCRANIIVGFPEQKRSELFKTFLFALKLAFVGINDVLILIFSPYKGSEFTAELVRKKQFNFDDLKERNSTSLLVVKSYAKNISSFELFLMRNITMAMCYFIQFTLRPHRIFSIIKNLYTRRPVTILENLLYLKFMNKKTEIAGQISL